MSPRARARVATLIAVAFAAIAVSPAAAKPAPNKARSTKSIPLAKKGRAARITIGRAGELRPAREAVGRREEPLTIEEETAKQIAKLLRGPLRNGLTGLYVADAVTGQPLFAVNADDPMNPASNVKMISTATALELLGPEFRYPTRVLGPEPINGVVHGDVFLLGSYDPTLTTADFDEIAYAMAARGVTSVQGDVVVGSDPTRDGIFRALIPVEITAGEPGEPIIATLPVGADHVTVNIIAKTSKRAHRIAKTSKRAHRPRLTYKTETTIGATGIPLITLTISGTLGSGGSTMYPLWTKERTATAAYALRASLRSFKIAVAGDMQIAELGDFIGDAVNAGSLPVELGRHESRRLADIVARVNKWSVNWLADRVITTAAALATHAPPSMDLAIEQMYGWLQRHAGLARKDLLIDTGSGLSYRTEITPTELVAIIRAAGGFMEKDSEPDPVAKAWLDSLSIAGSDGTLRHRVLNGDLRARIRGKSGTLSTVIAMSGILDVDPTHPLAFSLVTNTDGPLSKFNVRKAHDLVMGTLCTYLAKTSKAAAPILAPQPMPRVVPSIVDPAAPTPAPAPAPIEPEDTSPGDHALDAEAAAS